jgi:opacity protein-like surface antigen
MRKVFLVIIAVSFAFGVNAQIRFGVKAGGTLSNLTSEYNGVKDDAFKAGIGFNIGGVLEYSFTESFALQPELLYVMNNIKPKDEDAEIVDMNMKLQFQSIQIPINLKYKFGTESLKFYVTAGPYLGYITSAKIKAEMLGIKISADLYDMDELEDADLEGIDFGLKHLDFGVGAGFGIEISSKFTVGVGYQYGLSNLTKVDQASLKTGAFNLSVGYFF